MEITINETQKAFILKAIWNIGVLYDFENINNKEFKKEYGTNKEKLKIEAEKLFYLIEVLK